MLSPAQVVAQPAQLVLLPFYLSARLPVHRVAPGIRVMSTGRPFDDLRHQSIRQPLCQRNSRPFGAAEHAMLKVLNISDKLGVEQRPVPVQAPRSRLPDHNESCVGWLNGSSSSLPHQRTANRRSSTPSQNMPTLNVGPRLLRELHGRGWQDRVGKDISHSRLFCRRHKLVVLEPLGQ